MTTNILSYLDRAAKRWPQKPAIADDKTSITFSEWRNLAESIGTAIINAVGDTPRRPVLVFTDRRVECLVGFMGVAESGNFYVPIDSRMPHERVSMICGVLDPVAAITITEADEKTLSRTGFAGAVLRYAEITATEPHREILGTIRKRIIDLDPVYCIFTSGSTGIPKGVLISHRGMTDLADWLVDTFGFDHNDSLGNQTPFYFDGSVKDICICLKAGATLNIIGKKYFTFPKLLVPFLNERHITAVLWATSAVVLVGNSRILDVALPEHLRLVTFAGEAMPAKQLNVWRRWLPSVRFVNLYGPTEITVDCTYYEVGRDFGDDEYIPIGHSCHNKDVLVLNEENRLAAPGECGELCVRGTGVALGYYNNPSKTREVFVQNPLHNLYNDIIYRTGDIVRSNSRGELEFVSRKDFQIKHKGNRIELGEIEVAVNAIDGVTNAACVFDSALDRIVLFYTSDSHEDIDIINSVKNKIPVYMFPEVIIRLEGMPYSLNGKIDRTELKKIYESRKN